MSNGQLGTATSEALARLDNRWGNPWTPHDTDSVRDSQFIRYWDEIDPTTADTLVTTMLATTTVTDPLVDGQTLTGLFVVSDVWAESDNKRHVRIYQKLTRVTAASTIAELPTPTVTPGLNEVADYGQLATGEVQTRIFRYTHLSPDATTREMLMDVVTDAQWNTELTTYFVGMTIEFRKWEVEPRGDRTGTLIIGGKIQTWTGSSSTGYDIGYTGAKTQKLDSSDDQGHQYEVTTQYPGVPIASAATEAATLRDTATTDFAVEDVAVRYGNDGQATITTQKTQTSEMAEADYAVTNMFLVAQSRVPNEVSFVAPNVTQAVADAFAGYWGTAGNSITYGGVTYTSVDFKIERHRSGLCSFHLHGKVPSASGGSAGWVAGTVDVFKRYFTVDNTGVAWRVTIGRKITSSATVAEVYADGSSTRPVVNGEMAHKGGSVEYDSGSELYAGYLETWESATSKPLFSS